MRSIADQTAKMMNEMMMMMMVVVMMINGLGVCKKLKTQKIDYR
jgi:hypothetical protein